MSFSAVMVSLVFVINEGVKWSDGCIGDEFCFGSGWSCRASPLIMLWMRCNIYLWSSIVDFLLKFGA